MGTYFDLKTFLALVLSITFLMGCTKSFVNESSESSIIDDDAPSIQAISYLKSASPTSFLVSINKLDSDNIYGAAFVEYCNDTDASGCDPSSGESFTINTLLDSGAEIVGLKSGLSSTYDPGDKLNIRISLVDDDNVLGSSVETTVTLKSTIDVFRSVGYGTTSSLADGTTNGMTIYSSVAQFENDLPNNIGVGDVIEYDCNEDNISGGPGNLDANDCLIVIHERLSSTKYVVHLPSGEPVTSDLSTADNDWQIFRAHTNASNAVDSGAVNSGIDSDLAADLISGPLDLVAGGLTWNVALYADAVNVGSFDVRPGWTTSQVNRIRVFTPYESSQVGISQRHSGTEFSGFKVTETGDGVDTVFINTEHVTIEGLVVENIGTGAGSNSAISAGWASGIENQAHIIIRDNILRVAGNTSNDNGIGLWNSNNYGLGSEMYIFNNIIYGVTGSTMGYGIRKYSNSHDLAVYMYNNTIAGDLENGIIMSTSAGGDNFAYNNLVQGATSAAYGASDFNVASSNNLGNDASNPGGGVNNFANITNVNFHDSSGYDFRLTTSDTAAAGNGMDASSVFTTDILGNIRTVPWDIGATIPVP